jgi:predicted AlkP superfamily phosphohydrolase/phosphomutase
VLDRQSSHKVIVVGLDGATWDLILPWVDEGRLPNFAYVMQNGTWGKLRTTIQPVSPVAWNSFLTGMNPGKHGVYDFIKRVPSGYEHVPVSSRDRRGWPIWDILGWHGKKVGVINIPATYPPDRVNGFMISGFPTPEAEGDFTYPRELLVELETELGINRFQPDVFYTEGNEENFIACHYRHFEDTAEITRYLLNHKDWDFLMTVFTSGDSLSHGLWRFTDSKHPAYDSHKAARYGGRLFEIYNKIDQFLGEVRQLLDDQTTLVLLSDHGTGPQYYTLYLNNWLLRNGFLSLKRDPWTRLKYLAYRMGWGMSLAFRIGKALGLTRLGVEAVFSSKKRQGRSPLLRLADMMFLSFKDIDWSRTQAYSIGNFAQIYVNLRGREPQGIVAPGQEYLKVRQQIIERLREFVDPITGRKIFTNNIYSREDIYSGPYLREAPDVVFFDDELLYTPARNFEFGTNKLVTPHITGMSGNHKLDGIYAFLGQPIRKEQRVDAGIMDITPTILYLMDLPLHTEMDGQVLMDVLKPEFTTREPVIEPGPEEVFPPDSSDGFSEEERQAILEQLRGLGYVG